MHQHEYTLKSMDDGSNIIYVSSLFKVIGTGATNFEAIITYPNTSTQIPSSYQYTYTIKGTKVVDKYDNVNPDEVNASSGLTDNKTSNSNQTNTNVSNQTGDISSVDTNGNGKVTIKEAKDAGYSMPITCDHWLNIDYDS